jgi:hypothetical protein
LQTQRINAAYDILSDPQVRKFFDEATSGKDLKKVDMPAAWNDALELKRSCESIGSYILLSYYTYCCTVDCAFIPALNV